MKSKSYLAAGLLPTLSAPNVDAACISASWACGSGNYSNAGCWSIPERWRKERLEP